MLTIRDHLQNLRSYLREHGIDCHYRCSDDAAEASFWVGTRGAGGEVRFPVSTDRAATVDFLRMDPHLLQQALLAVGRETVYLTTDGRKLFQTSLPHRNSKLRRAAFQRARQRGMKLTKGWA